MVSRDEIADLDSIAQAALVRSGEVTAAELVEAAIERVERHNPSVNAIVTRMYDLALERASQPLPEGPLAGVPFLLKDFLAEYEGVRFTEASASLRHNVSTADSELVRRYKAAGLITVAKTNLPELAIGVTTEPRLFGPTRNPWSLDRLPGGSSGGAGAAVAVGMTPMAHGNDAGGSIRIPASCCGVFGLKPTRGRNPLGPEFGDVMSGLVAEHALTRTVRDSAALLDATAGPDVGDPYPVAHAVGHPSCLPPERTPAGSASASRSARRLATRCTPTASRRSARPPPCARSSATTWSKRCRSSTPRPSGCRSRSSSPSESPGLSRTGTASWAGTASTPRTTSNPSSCRWRSGAGRSPRPST